MSDTPSDSLDAGRVGRAHGLDGSFYVTGARPRLLSTGVTITVAGHSARIVRRAGLAERPILRLDGIDSREAAEALRGAVLSVPVTTAPQLAPGEWWAHQLEGCEVTDGERRVGTVLRLLELPSCEALEVERPDAPALLVPMVSDAIRNVDVPAQRIDVDLAFLGEPWK